MKKVALLYVLILSRIFSVAAQGIAGATNTVWERVMDQLVNPIFTLLIVITTTYFLWGMLTFIYSLREGNKDSDLNEGKSHMLWGGLGLFIIFSISGIIKLLNSMFDGWFGN